MNSWVVNLTFGLLVVLSIVSWTIAIVKVRQFQSISSETQEFQRQFWEAKNWQEGEYLAQSSSSDVAQLAKVGFLEFLEYQKTPERLKYVGEVQEVLERPMRQETQRILRMRERGLAELASIGSTAPFIGLFGTVWGIMNALKEIGLSGQATLDIVAGPIGEALISTAIGIATALPAVYFYNYFVRKMKLWVTDMDGFTEAFLRLVSKQSHSE